MWIHFVMCNVMETCVGELSLKNRKNVEIRLAIGSKYIALFNQRSGYSSLYFFHIHRSIIHYHDFLNY